MTDPTNQPSADLDLQNVQNFNTVDDIKNVKYTPEGVPIQNIEETENLDMETAALGRADVWIIILLIIVAVFVVRFYLKNLGKKKGEYQVGDEEEGGECREDNLEVIVEEKEKSSE